MGNGACHSAWEGFLTQLSPPPSDDVSGLAAPVYQKIAYWTETLLREPSSAARRFV